MTGMPPDEGVTIQKTVITIGPRAMPSRRSILFVYLDEDSCDYEGSPVRWGRVLRTALETAVLLACAYLRGFASGG